MDCAMLLRGLYEFGVGVAGLQQVIVIACFQKAFRVCQLGSCEAMGFRISGFRFLGVRVKKRGNNTNLWRAC